MSELEIGLWKLFCIFVLVLYLIFQESPNAATKKKGIS